MEATTQTHIEKRQTRAGDTRAYIKGTRVRVQNIAADHELHGLTPEQIAREYPQLTLAQVHADLSYFFDHREEVRDQMKRDIDLVDGLQAQLHTRGESKDAASLPS